MSYKRVRKSKSPLELVCRIVRLDGEVRYIHLRSVIESDRKGKSFLSGTAQDITIFEKSSQKTLQTDPLIGKCGPIMRVGRWKFKFPERNLTWLSEIPKILELDDGISPTMEKLFGFFTNKYRGNIRQYFEFCERDGTPFDSIMQLVTTKGRPLWVRIIGQAEYDRRRVITSVKGILQDVTEIKQADENVFRVVSRLTHVLESITDAFFTLDDNWRFTYGHLEIPLRVWHDVGASNLT